MLKHRFSLYDFLDAKERARKGERVAYRDTPNGRVYWCGFDQWHPDRDSAIRISPDMRPRFNPDVRAELA